MRTACRSEGWHGDLRARGGSRSGRSGSSEPAICTRATLPWRRARLGVDYVFFGRPHGDTHDSPHPKALDLAEWWSELMQIPAVMMAGRSLDSVREAAATGAAFVALHDAVWSHASGPGEAVRIA